MDFGARNADLVEKLPPIIGTRETAINFIDVRGEVDFFAECSKLDPLDVGRTEDTNAVAAVMLEKESKVFKDSVLKEEHHKLDHIILDIFRASLPAGPRQKSNPFKLSLHPRRGLFMSIYESTLKSKRILGLLCEPTCGNTNGLLQSIGYLTCASLAVLKSGSTLFRFAVDLISVYRLTMKHQFPVSVL